jgi:hypothetical protein
LGPFGKVCGTEVMPDNLLDAEVTSAAQEPLLTLWQTIGSLAHFATKCLDFLLLLAKACCKMTKTDVRENVVASNLLSLASSDWILANVCLIAGVAKSWLKPHMRWHQSSDPHIGTLGFLCFHRQVRCFLMMEDLKKMEMSLRKMEDFEQFSKKLFTMNPTLKKLKEDMATSFLRKMGSQVKKDNKQRLLTKHLVRGVCTEWETGQALAQFLKGGDGAMPKIDCQKFVWFLGDEVPLALLSQLWTNPAVQFHREAIDQTAVESDVWDETNATNENSHLLRSQALQCFAAHASTQHNNERINFCDRVEQPKRRKHGNHRGKKKLLDLECEANKKSNQSAAIATNLGAQAHSTRMKTIATSLESKADNLVERSSDVKVGTMMAMFDIPDKPENARQQKRGKDMPPRLFRHFPCMPVGRKMNIGELGKELRMRNIMFESALKVAKKWELLKKDKVWRVEEQVDANLTARGCQFCGLKLPAKLQLISCKPEMNPSWHNCELSLFCKKLIKNDQMTLVLTLVLEAVRCVSGAISSFLRILLRNLASESCFRVRVTSESEWHVTCDMWHVTCDDVMHVMIGDRPNGRGQMADTWLKARRDCASRIRQDAKKKEDRMNGEHKRDTAKHFKLLSPDVDKTIFEDEQNTNNERSRQKNTNDKVCKAMIQIAII